MKLIPNWRKAWRMVSVQSMALAAAVQGSWMFIPDDMRTSIPHNIVQGVTLALLALGMAGRLVVQPAVKDDDAGKP